MAATTSNIAEGDRTVSVEEYIARFVDGGEKPTCEYLDGELLPKSMGTKKHSKTQQNVQYYIRQKYGDAFDPLPELTARLRRTRFCVPDVAVEDRARPIQGRYPGPDDPVFLCVEIVSPPDRVGRLFSKCEEYHKWGVPYCWILDPERKVAWEYTPGDVEPRRVADALTAGPIRLTLDEVFERV
ncbi:MAG TPA: Uma2 family endonuclease [Bryobacteraceae bacterium]|jgi:Uma2 family endonuclease|nr:Uma2 family endonuclease [Bryobacteraceae bacterium]